MPLTRKQLEKHFGDTQFTRHTARIILDGLLRNGLPTIEGTSPKEIFDFFSKLEATGPRTLDYLIHHTGHAQQSGEKDNTQAVRILPHDY